MKESSIVRLLRAPDIELVDFAIRRANLTWKEALAVDLCGRRGYTQESAAEHAGYSVDAMQKWYRSGIAKLSIAWGGCWWICAVVDTAETLDL